MEQGRTNQGTALIDSHRRRGVADTVQVPRPRRRRFTPVPDPVFEGIPARLKQVRDKAGLSTRELAEAAGVSQAHVVNIENGHAQNITITTLARLADALKVPREWLIFGIVGIVAPEPSPQPTDKPDDTKRKS